MLPTKSNVTRPEAWGYGASLNELYLRLAVGPDRPMTVETAASEAERIQTAENPEDFSSDYGQTFSRADLSGGEGLDLAHRRQADDADWSRYFDSRNVDVTAAAPGAPFTLKLLHVTEGSAVDASASMARFLLNDGGTLYWAVGSDVKRCANPTAASPTVASENPEGTTPSTIVGMCRVGSVVYAALDHATEKIRKRDGTWATATAQFRAADLWSAKGRVFYTKYGETNKLYQLDLAGSGTDVLELTLPSGSTVRSIIDVGSHIVMACSDYTLRSFTWDGADLNEVAVFNTVDETPYAVGFAQGVFFYSTGNATSASGVIGRLYRATVDAASGSVLEAQLIRTWGDGAESRDRAPRHLAATRDSIYLAVPEGDGEIDLWRYQLATSGLSRDLIFDGVGAGNETYAYLASVDDRMFAAVEGSGLWREDTLYAASGWLISPAADFYTSEPKQWVGATLSTDELPVNTQADLFVSVNLSALTNAASAAWTFVTRVTTGQGGTETRVSDLTGRWGAAKVVLTSLLARDATPSVRSFSLRTYAQVDDVVVQVPVNVSDIVESPNRRRLRVKGQGARVFTELLSYKGASVTFELFRPPMVVRGVVTSVRGPILSISERGSVSSFAMLEIRGSLYDPAVSYAGDSSLGVGSLGVELLGV